MAFTIARTSCNTCINVYAIHLKFHKTICIFDSNFVVVVVYSYSFPTIIDKTDLFYFSYHKITNMSVKETPYSLRVTTCISTLH